MTVPCLIARLDDEASVEAISDAIASWEPRLDLQSARDNPRIYEPDGTLYAAALPPAANLVVRYKERILAPGDLAVIPRGVAIDAEEPGASYVAIRHDGTPPVHFRERFIQTWGYEHRPALLSEIGDEPRVIIPEDDARFRIPYRVEPFAGPARPLSSRFELHVWVVLEGTLVVSVPGSEPLHTLQCGGLLLVPPHVAYSIEGTGRAGRFLLETEETYGAKLATHGSDLSPEFRVNA